MLSGDFFYITSLNDDNGTIKALLELNPAHKIFGGHFPGRPVVPGVCMIQMVKEIVESVLIKPTRLISADNLKFLTVINPFENNNIHAELKYTIDDGKIKVIASLVNEQVVCFKMTGIFTLIG